MKSNFNKYPVVNVQGSTCTVDWKNIAEQLTREAPQTIAIECYPGVFLEEIITSAKLLNPELIINTTEAMKTEDEIAAMVQKYVTDDPVFGYISPLELEDYFDQTKIAALQNMIGDLNGRAVVVGPGATLLCRQPDLSVYADMPRWEIQMRYRKNTACNLGKTNYTDSFAYQYKHAYFVDWRVCDRYKKRIFAACHFVLDTTIPLQPKMIRTDVLLEAFAKTVQQPFRVVPFFDPGPWGGQWLKEVCDLDRSQPNYAWGFDCVPEENSLLFGFGDDIMEVPSINLVFFQPEALLGKQVYEGFGDEFPIRFDFLDTMEGGNLSLQVHPLKEYIKEKFGMSYTQDESYYMLDAKEDAFVYLGLKENTDPEHMMNDLVMAQKEHIPFDAEQYVQKWPVRKHDHVSIPAGTVHCSGADSVVLEISATPYIFTFKLWDWGRMGLDGKPRPISLEHGQNVIQWDRTTSWTEKNILNLTEPIAEGDGWREERTGLDALSFIETRRHWFTKKVVHHTEGVVNVVNLVEGREVIVESPDHDFEPYIIHYAETFIVPAHIGTYTITPYGESAGKECATIKASIRTEMITHKVLN
ncbi:class I mannose-6-phosphate isomerase [Chryseobacterium pennipullorum]|uniref:Mannose-6-phosphate isomerase n=1 Tax=Chryseobacterium pennipullorum TaxID=2258963 RepID=A0A3D9B6M8_9FLAO|nr:class I mannose-6-phosphate isomerase [Chryseobacterium pennipullorum]REC48886.1 mannose-6-phosphate isomerase [Chryseobacterium pennipullorum]